MIYLIREIKEMFCFRKQWNNPSVMFHLEMNIGIEKFKEALSLLSSDETNTRNLMN